MVKKNYTHEAFLTHVVSIDLLDYLCPVHKKEVLKVDAFRSLLNKTCQQPTGTMTKEGTPLVVKAGQLVTSVSELARAWDWHRDKVRDFVDALAERKVLTIDMHKKFMVLSFPDLADRIAPYAPKADSEPSADPSPSPVKTNEEKGQQTQNPSGTEQKAAVANSAVAKSADSGNQHGDGKQENGKPATANNSGYSQPNLFSHSNNTGNHYLSGNSNKH